MTFQTHLPNPMMLSDPTYKSKEMPNFQAFQASQMRNPWAHQQLNNAQFPALQSWHVAFMTKETSWGLSVLSPEVESRNARCVWGIIICRSSRKHKQRGSSTRKSENTWTIAEELADAIFPSNYEKDATQATHVHHGLLNFKLEIERLRTAVEGIKSKLLACIHFDVHEGLLNHKIEIEGLQASIEDLK